MSDPPGPFPAVQRYVIAQAELLRAEGAVIAARRVLERERAGAARALAETGFSDDDFVPVVLLDGSRWEIRSHGEDVEVVGPFSS